mmetsp:Transcript_7703/g.16755  ORF Transcript_7703/g.16755 Transcript_7703/m.16755 type:complete len:222 (+) Transcript_7703:781-1446(+)
MKRSARSSLSWLGSTGASRLGSLDTSTWAKITKTVSLSPPSTPRTVPTPTVAHASSHRPPSCAQAPPVTADSNPVSSVETRMDSKSAPLTTKRMERSDLMPPSPSVEMTMRLVSTLMRTRLTSMINTLRCTSLTLVISFTPRMRVSRCTILMETLSRLTSPWTLLPGGTCPAAALLACSTETSSNTTRPPLPPLGLLLELMNLLVKRLALSTLDLMLTLAP